MAYLTQAQARDRWCPFGRAESTQEGPATSVSRAWNGGPDASCMCLASGCMAWRGIPADNGENKIEGIRRRREETGCSLLEAKTYVETHPDYLRRQPPESGYCGLAGRPE